MEASNEGLLAAAAAYARKAHDDLAQRRKYTGEPYWFHCREVARLVEVAGGDDAMIAAAWLHDTIEDTGATREKLEELFGLGVAELVWWLSDASKPSDGNRKARKNIDLAHIAAAPARAQTVKLADLISNGLSIAIWDPDFARVYLHEKERVLAVLTSGDPGLMDVAVKALEFARCVERLTRDK